MDLVWPEPVVERLIVLYNEDRLTCRGMAEKLAGEFGLPINKNMVIGKTQRMMRWGTLAKKVKFGRPLKTPRPKRIKKKGELVLPPDPLDIPDDNIPMSQRRMLLELTPFTCRYPIGDGPFYFCGAIADAGCPYCTMHYRRTHLPAKPKRPYIPGRVAA